MSQPQAQTEKSAISVAPAKTPKAPPMPATMLVWTTGTECSQSGLGFLSVLAPDMVSRRSEPKPTNTTMTSKNSQLRGAAQERKARSRKRRRK